MSGLRESSQETDAPGGRAGGRRPVRTTRRKRWCIRPVVPLGLPNPPLEVMPMLFVGVDWASAEHAACVLRPDGAVARRLTVPH